VKLFKNHLQKAHTVVWNGPVGYCEWEQFSHGTKEIGRFIGKIDAIAVAGGGETVQFLQKFHLAPHFTHLSTGGGASIDFLSGKKLPGIEALEENYEKWKGKIKT
jgi:phosphoglycerate kinase